MQTLSKALDIGVDVGKDEIATASAEGGFSRRKVSNQRTELKAFLTTPPAGSRIGMESTGSYHELLAGPRNLRTRDQSHRRSDIFPVSGKPCLARRRRHS